MLDQYRIDLEQAINDGLPKYAKIKAYTLLGGITAVTETKPLNFGQIRELTDEIINFMVQIGK